MQTQAQAQQAQVQQAKNISDQIKQERLRQHNILESQRMSNEPSLASALGDPASSLASSVGSAASSATSSLLKVLLVLLRSHLLHPRFAHHLLKSSDVFPQSSSLFSSDVFPQSRPSQSMSSSVELFSQQSPPSNIYSLSFREQYGINQPLLPSEYPSWHPSSNPSPSPYPVASDTSALSAALPQGMRSASSASASASAAPSRAMRSSSILAQPSSASQIP